MVVEEEEKESTTFTLIPAKPVDVPTAEETSALAVIENSGSLVIENGTNGNAPGTSTTGGSSDMVTIPAIPGTPTASDALITATPTAVVRRAPKSILKKADTPGMCVCIHVSISLILPQHVPPTHIRINFTPLILNQTYTLTLIPLLHHHPTLT